MSNKELLRKEMLSKRKSLSVAEVQESGARVSKYLSNLNLFQQSSSVLFYSPIDNEVNVITLAKKAMEDTHKRVIFPRVTANGLELHNITSFEDLILGKYGIMEPKKNIPPWNTNNLDLILVPGIAFDRNGFKLGYGFGYYDKLLHNLDIPCIGLAYDWQIVNNIHHEKHDIPVHHIITNNEIINCQRNN